MIQAIILDIDGILVGERIGYNSPSPHPHVIEQLKLLGQSGVTISLCTAKPYRSIEGIIREAYLDNLHITDGGAVITDPIHKHQLQVHSIPTTLAHRIVKTYLENDIYVELYTPDEYLIQNSQECPLTAQHTHILQYSPRIVGDLIGSMQHLQVVKIMPIARDEMQKKHIEKLFISYQDVATLSWGVHPVARPHCFGIITATGISKQQATRAISYYLGVESDALLGVGDSISDWQFMQYCGFVATLKNGASVLKQYVEERKERGFIEARSVDENGILEVFKHFFPTSN